MQQWKKFGIDAEVYLSEAAPASTPPVTTTSPGNWPAQEPWGAGPDLYRVLDRYNSAYVKPLGDTTNGHLSRWSSPKMDAVIEKLRETDPADYEAVVAVGIEGPEDGRAGDARHPHLRLYRLHHLGPTYWTNWPGSENAYTQPYTHWGPFKYMTPFLKADRGK